MSTRTVIAVIASSRTDLEDDDDVNVTSFSALDVVEIKEVIAVVVAESSRTEPNDDDVVAGDDVTSFSALDVVEQNKKKRCRRCRCRRCAWLKWDKMLCCQPLKRGWEACHASPSGWVRRPRSRV